jgi:hypothetical protein
MRSPLFENRSDGPTNERKYRVANRGCTRETTRFPSSWVEYTGPSADCDFRANLWTQKWTGPNNAYDKDKVEDALHRLVCSGRKSLAEAQRRIATDWKHALDGTDEGQ